MKARNINPLLWERRLHSAYATSLFKPLGFPSGRVKSRENLPRMIPKNILKYYVVNKKEFSHRPWFRHHEQV
jgi:hypothetical protein